MRYDFLTSPEHALFEAAQELSELSFPAPLRRDRSAFAAAFSDPAFECLVFREREAVIGFVSLWYFPDYLFLEAIAVAPEFRGLGLGSERLRDLMTSVVNPIAALSHSAYPAALDFFTKNRFVVNQGRYLLPEGVVPEDERALTLLTYPKPFTQAKSLALCRDLEERVFPSLFSKRNAKWKEKA